MQSVEETIQSFVETYELSTKAKVALARIAIRRAKELHLTSSEEIYGDISFLADSFSKDAGRKRRGRLVSLESPLVPDSDFSLLDAIGTEDATLHNMMGEEALEQRLEILKEQVSNTRVRLVLQLLSQASKEGKVSLEQLIERLVSFENVQKWLRSFGKELTRQHYSGSELNGVDHFNPTIRDYWRDAGFRPNKSHLEDGERARIVLALILNGGNIQKTAMQLSHSDATVWRYAFRLGLNTYDKGELTKAQRGKVVAAYNTFNGNARGASNKTPYSRSTFLKYWRAVGFEIKPPYAYGRSLTLEERAEAIEAHMTYNRNATEASRHLSHKPETFLRIWREAGLKIGRPGNRGLTESERKEVVVAYEQFGGNASQAANHLPYSRSTFTRFWRDAGLEIKPPRAYLRPQGTWQS